MGETPTRSTCVTSWGSTTCRAARSASRWRGWRRPRPRSGQALAPSSALQEKIAGQVIGPGDPDYEQARHVWNAIADRRPSLIVRPSSVDDVIAAIRFAREQQLVVAVRGGGHSVAGFLTCGGGVGPGISPNPGGAGGALPCNGPGWGRGAPVPLGDS